jgi:CheY-like chemotaxis protein
MANKFKVLVAEDDEDDRFLIQRAFSKAGINTPVQFAHDGQETIDQLQNIGNSLPGAASPHPSLLLLDLKMPRLDGFQVLEWLNQNASQRPSMVVVFTSSSDPKDMRRAEELGADSYVVKPNSSLEYVKIVQDLQNRMASIAASRVAEHGWNVLRPG